MTNGAPDFGAEPTSAARDHGITPDGNGPASPTVAGETVQRAVAMTSYLLVLEGASSTVFHLPHDGDVVVGRGVGAQLHLHDPSVSRAHARISMHDGKATVADLGSQNGTRVNGEPVVGSRALSSGDVITLLQVTIVFHGAGRSRPGRQLLSAEAFRHRVDEELERVAAGRRSFVVAVISLARGGGDPDAAQLLDPVHVARAVEPHLRRLDVVAQSGSEVLVLAPEVDADGVQLTVGRLLKTLTSAAGEPRAGIASAPADGIDVDSLLVGARAARDRAGPGEIGVAASTFREIDMGGHKAVVADPAMLRLVNLLERLARADLPVLVCGETGAGKELAASVVHRWSSRAKQPLVVLNCAALPDTLAESELFGHEKGAFTGATSHKIGSLEAASGGTVFLDELGELSLAIQAKLLRALETKRITRLGGTVEIDADFRIVAATNRNLQAEVVAGRFRQDLLFRLGGATVWLPPLRDRKREIPILAVRFLVDACARARREPMTISSEAMRLLLEHTWPGNVRELRNVMDYLAAAHDEPEVAAWHVIDRLAGAAPRARSASEASLAELPAADAPVGELAPPPGGFVPIEDEVRELERTRMAQALAVAAGNQTVAAELIKMPLRTFQAKARNYGLRAKDRRP